MKNYLLAICLFVGVQNIALSQSRIVMGGGIISSSILSSANPSWLEETKPGLKPFVGFTYEYNLNQNLFLSTNSTYSRQGFDYYPVDLLSPEIDYFILPNTKFVQISAGVLINYKVLSPITNSKFWNGFNVGLGLNVDHLRDFKSEFFLSTENYTHKDNRNQFGFIYHLSWEYNKFRLTYNVGDGIKMFGNHENLVASTNWRTLSASYIYTLSE